MSNGVKNMNQLNLQITGESNLENAVIEIDGKPVNLKRNKSKKLAYSHSTTQDKAVIRICKYLDVGGVVWFLTQIFFFLISIFGIFDLHSKNRCLCFDYFLEVDLQENSDVKLYCKPPRENQPAIQVETELQTAESGNVYFVNKKAKRTLKGLRITKILLTIAIIILAVIIVVMKLK